jgi:hypothetical protein
VDKYKRLPKTVDEEIEMISGNLWGGYGRTGGIQLELDVIPVPSSEVFNNLLDVAMSPSAKQEVLTLYQKLFTK